MIVLYLAFGQNQRIHQQVLFSALTVLSWREPDTEVVVFTDVPQYYRLPGSRLTVRVPGAAVLQEWKGPHDFFFRVKMRALQELLCDTTAHDLLYLDGDTFCFGPPAGLSELMQQGTHLMHAREGKLSTLPTKTEQRMWKMCAGRTFGGVRVDEHSTMYNAGVVGLRRRQAAAAADLALAVCDDMLAYGVPERLVEQLAFSLALAETGGVRAANHVIGHYWGNKAEWDGFISDFLVRQLLVSAPPEAILDAVKNIDFRSLPVYRKSSGTHRKLTRWVDALFLKDRHAFVSGVEAAGSDLSDR